ncbi:DUF4406 domain-containing protein [Methanoculleus sp. UBA312]|uniref:DUF4406 domain-containing protein n=1 Tax=Methanoculleus sp. UBA312 TaxID=1915499 RepID=UPI0031BA2C79
MTPTAPGPRVLYISGPFSHPDPVHGIPKNILQASEAALVAWRDGWAVHCPHKNCAGFEHAAGIPYETWIAGDLELLRRSDAICMVGLWTESRGAVVEYRLARSLGLPVYRYVAEEIRPMPAPMLQSYDALAEGAVP